MKRPTQSPAGKGILVLAASGIMSACTPDSLPANPVTLGGSVEYSTGTNPNPFDIVENGKIIKAMSRDGDTPPPPPPPSQSSFTVAEGWEARLAPGHINPTRDEDGDATISTYSISYPSVSYLVNEDGSTEKYELTHLHGSIEGCPYAMLEAGPDGDEVVYFPDSTEEAVLESGWKNDHGLGNNVCGIGSYGYDPETGLQTPNELIFRSVTDQTQDITTEDGTTFHIYDKGTLLLKRDDAEEDWDILKHTYAAFDSYWNEGADESDTHMIGLTNAYPGTSDEGLLAYSTQYGNPSSNYFTFICSKFTYLNDSTNISRDDMLLGLDAEGSTIQCMNPNFGNQENQVVSEQWAGNPYWYDKTAPLKLVIANEDDFTDEEIIAEANSLSEFSLDPGADPCTGVMYWAGRNDSNVERMWELYREGTDPDAECVIGTEPVDTGDTELPVDTGDSSVEDTDDTTETDTNDTGEGEPEDCGCESTPSSPAGALGLMLATGLAVATRRRQREVELG